MKCLRIVLYLLNSLNNFFFEYPLAILDFVELFYIRLVLWLLLHHLSLVDKLLVVMNMLCLMVVVEVLGVLRDSHLLRWVLVAFNHLLEVLFHGELIGSS